MQYKVVFDINPKSLTQIEAPSPHDAAAIFYLKNPTLEQCIVRVILNDGAEERFHTSELSAAVLPTPSSLKDEAQANRDQERGKQYAQRARVRYSDAYTVAGAVVGFGGMVKAVGVIVGIIGILGGILAASSSGLFLVGGVALGVVGGIPIYVLGVLVSALGQQTKACLDSAVHSSPFLSDSEKASVMSLK